MSTLTGSLYLSIDLIDSNDTSKARSLRILIHEPRIQSLKGAPPLADTGIKWNIKRGATRAELPIGILPKATPP